MKRFLAALGIGMGAVVLLAPFTRAISKRKLREVRGRHHSFGTRGATKAERAEVVDSDNEHRDSGEQRVIDIGAERLNRISREELLEVNGIGPVLADRIISGQPYSSLRELRERKILPQGAFDELVRELAGTHRRSA